MKVDYRKVDEKGGREVVYKNRTGKVSSADLKDCIGCGLCALRCTTGAVTLKARPVKIENPKDLDQLMEWATEAEVSMVSQTDVVGASLHDG